MKSHDFVAARLKSAFAAKNIAAVDFMRALAILLVLGYHLHFPVSGNLGVVLFFVLSGFLITSILLREESRTGTIDFKNFYVRRAYRIFPAFYVAVALYLLVSFFRHQLPPLWQFLTTVFYLNDYGRAVTSLSTQRDYFMNMTWSLGTEEKFYFIWPIALRALLARKWTHSRICRLLCGVIVCIIVVRTAVVLGFPEGGKYAYNAFEMRADTMMAGACLAVASAASTPSRFLTFPLRSAWMTLPPLFALGAICYAEFTFSTSLSLACTFAVEGPIAAFALLQWIYWGSTGLRFMGWAPIRYIARISYSLYLYHLLAFSFESVWPRGTARVFSALFAFLLATLSYFFIEKPFLRLRDRTAKQPAAA